MKHYILTFIFAYSVSTFKTQVFQSSCVALEEVTKKYKIDADALALQAVYTLNDTYKDSIEIKPSLSNKFLSAIIAIYNSTNHPARDTVFDLLNIRALHIRDMNHMYVSADSNQIWMKNLRNNIVPTGNSQVDFLMNKYFLKKVTYYDLLGQVLNHSVSFETDTNCNILALSKKFISVPGYNSSGENQWVMDGDKIYDSITTNYTQLIFYHAWNDCPSGCINGRAWKFRVYNDCSVEYFGSFGDALPPGVGIKPNGSILNTISVYPNPSSSRIFIYDEAKTNTDYKLHILNQYGETVYSVDSFKLNTEIELEFLPKGLYFLQLQYISEKKVIKIVKE